MCVSTGRKGGHASSMGRGLLLVRRMVEAQLGANGKVAGLEQARHDAVRNVGVNTGAVAVAVESAVRGYVRVRGSSSSGNMHPGGDVAYTSRSMNLPPGWPELGRACSNTLREASSRK